MLSSSLSLAKSDPVTARLKRCRLKTATNHPLSPFEYSCTYEPALVQPFSIVLGELLSHPYPLHLNHRDPLFQTPHELPHYLLFPLTACVLRPLLLQATGVNDSFFPVPLFQWRKRATQNPL